jgi:hypothetical protein
MARKNITDKKAVGSTPGSTPEYGYKAKKASTRKVSSKKAGVKDLSSISRSTPKDGYKAKKVSTRKVSSKKAGVEDLSSISIHEKVALLAYSYWEERGGQGGSPEDDWLRAEREVLAGVIQKNS